MEHKLESIECTVCGNVHKIVKSKIIKHKRPARTGYGKEEYCVGSKMEIAEIQELLAFRKNKHS